MNRSQLADMARELNIPIADSHTRGHLIRSIRGHHLQQSTPVASDYPGFGKHGAKTYQEVLKLDSGYCRWIDQVEDQQPHWKLKRFSSWLKMQRVPHQPNLENNMTRNAWRDASKNSRKRNCSTTALEKKNLVLEQHVQELMEHVQLLMKPSQECGVARLPKSSAGWPTPEGKTRWVLWVLTRWPGQTNKHDSVQKYHLGVFERCRRGTLMNRVETLRMSVLSFPTPFFFGIGSLQTKHSRKDIGVCETHLAECRTPSAHGFRA